MSVVFHGTRLSADVILTQGLKYPGTDELVSMIHQSLIEAGLSPDVWLQHQEKLKREGRFTTLGELSRDYRRVIWVTEFEDNAWSYASRSPEIVSEAIIKEYVSIHYRRKNVFNEANTIADKSRQWIGEPKVVVIDADSIGAGRGNNQPISPYIPPEFILDILEE